MHSSANPISLLKASKCVDQTGPLPPHISGSQNQQW